MKHGRCGSEACRLERTSLEVPKTEWVDSRENLEPGNLGVYPLKPILEKIQVIADQTFAHLGGKNQWIIPLHPPSPVVCSLKMLPATMQNFTSCRFKGVGQALHKWLVLKACVYIYTHMCLSYLYSHLNLYTCV